LTRRDLLRRLLVGSGTVSVAVTGLSLSPAEAAVAKIALVRFYAPVSGTVLQATAAALGAANVGQTSTRHGMMVTRLVVKSGNKTVTTNSRLMVYEVNGAQILAPATTYRVRAGSLVTWYKLAS